MYPTTKVVQTKVYSTYNSLKTRCYNVNHPSYKLYGAWGVTMCDEWKNDFQAFASWYTTQCTLLGINPEHNNYQVDKDILCDELNINPKIYSPQTCKLITQLENLQYAQGLSDNNKHVIITPTGAHITVDSIKDFSIEHGLSYNAMRNLTSGRTKQHKGYTLKS